MAGLVGTAGGVDNGLGGDGEVGGEDGNTAVDGGTVGLTGLDEDLTGPDIAHTEVTGGQEIQPTKGVIGVRKPLGGVEDVAGCAIAEDVGP